ncbi:MAG: apolipoprotein N-acyltransferase [Omnitrophica bacterium]|nr:apolipoprotein N-acyltransferase [Candidatus Omnitrophota bacterium]
MLRKITENGPSALFPKGNRALSPFLPVLSAVLLILAYPTFNLEFLAWIALIPLFFALEGKTTKQRFTIGYLFGIIFFSGILYWLVNVSIPGAIFLILVLSFFPALFSTLYPEPPYEPPKSIRAAGWILFIPAAWVLTEYLRTHFLTGFPWALLAYSQSFNLPVIQIADITGPYGVSFLIVLVNLGIYSALKKTPGRFYTLFFVFLLLAAVSGYGYNRLRRPYPTQHLKIALIQGNIPQALKWDVKYRRFIMDKYAYLTKEAAKDTPRLIIWPETSVPGYLEEEADLKRWIKDLAKSANAYIIAGTLREDGQDVFNSARLISKEGELLESYDKIHLVPFGEFIPFAKVISRIRAFIDKPIGDFARGKDFTVFKFQSHDAFIGSSNIQKTTEFYKFSTLICFEDIFPDLSRRFVKAGARFLVNITNDAWFGDTRAPYQHAQGSIFRAVENRVPVVRAANTGVSCIIDHRGRVVEYVRSGSDKTFVDGYAVKSIQPVFSKTFYTRFGDVFSWICIAIVGLCLFFAGSARGRIPLLILALILTSALSSCTSDEEIHYRGKLRLTLPFGKKYDYNDILVSQVIDGDTIELENRERVRLIGIDTPEARESRKLERDITRTKNSREAIIEMGKIATKFTKNLAEGKRVRLEFDVEKTDRYGRLLAYVYLPDGKMLNAELLKAGYAQLYTFQPNVKHVDSFLKLQKQARKTKKGFWK